MEFAERHLEILEAIGERGAEPTDLRRLEQCREFDDLRIDKLIVFWPLRQPRPSDIYGGGMRPGAWYLSRSGAEAVRSLRPALASTPRPKTRRVRG
jgi:hypothetical protein